jgi:UDP-glucose 4-epimerase
VTEIAKLAVECVGINEGEVQFEYTGGNRGWKGDIPVVRLNTDRIRRLGWTCRSGSREALRDSMLAMLPDAKAARL